MKLSKSAIDRMEREYRAEHKLLGCCRPLLENGVWRLCGWKPTQLHHNAHGSNKVDCPTNYIMLCVRPGTGGCHFGWFHEGDCKTEKLGEKMLRLFAVKYIFHEVSLHLVDELMIDREWWREEDGDIVAHQKLLKMVTEMQELFKTEGKRWELSKLKGAKR